MTSGSFGRTILILMIGGFAALLLVGAASVFLVQKTADDTALVVHSQQVQNGIARVLSLTQDAETGQRGYLLTKDEGYLAPYEAARQRLPDAISALKATTADNASFGPILAQLEKAVGEKLDELRRTIDLQRAGKGDEAMAVVLTGEGRLAMRQIRTLTGELLQSESRLLGERGAEFRDSSRWLLGVNFAALLLIAGVAAGSLMVVRRYTRDLKQAHAELAGANAGLETVVAQRTAELVRANEEVQRFAYIVSHDLRSPLVNIMGFTSELDASRKVIADQFGEVTRNAPELIKDEAKLAVEEDLPEAISFIRTSTTKMDRLINAILRLSREGRRVQTPEHIAMRPMIEQIAATLQQQANAANAEIKVEGLPDMTSDRLSIEQIFSNLVENAVKYLDTGRPGQIVVRGRSERGRVVYQIEDNGRGIDAKDHERVFELFRRSGAQDRPGEGLGLTFVRNSVRRLGGTITLASTPGQGTTFTLDFPKVLQRTNESLTA